MSQDSSARPGNLILVPGAISWLVPVFGAWFGWKVAAAGDRAGSLWRALGFTILALALLPIAGVVAGALGVKQTSLTMLGVFAVASVVAVLLGWHAWPELGRTLFLYGLAARVPVILVMLAAILGNWGTHYDVTPPGAPEMTAFSKWLLIGVLPQLTVWMAYTVVVGSLFGIPAAAIARRRPSSV